MIEYFLALPHEFINLKNSASCKNNKTKLLKEFAMSVPALHQIPGKHVAQIECELYCASEKTCWGCIQFSNDTFAWNAVSDCNQADTSEQLQIENKSQKLGKLALAV